MVPFGEYVPLRKILFFINKLVSGIGDYTPGNDYVKSSYFVRGLCDVDML